MSDELDSDFDAGFALEVTTPTTTPEEVKQDEQQATADPAPEPEPVIEYAQIRKDEYESLLAKVAEIDNIKNDYNGKFGGLKRTLDSFKNESTGEIEISDEDFAELTADYPEVADQTKAGLKRVLSKLRGAGQQQDPSLVERIYQEKITPELQKLSADFQSKLKAQTDFYSNDRVMSRSHPDWLEVIRDGEYQAFVTKEKLDADPVSHDVLAAQIAKFKAAKKPPEAIDNSARQKQLKQAVAPKSVGGHGTTSEDEDAFDAGFKGINQH